MKKLTLLNQKDSEKFLANVWSTPFFKESFDSKGYVWQKTKNFLNSKRYTAEMSNEQIEHSHFYSWFNILVLKKYDNPIVQDLYFLHEITHIATLVYDPSHSFDDWSYKMIQNEIEASIESEVFVYKHLPIRKSSFDFEIWADLIPDGLTKTEIFFQRMNALLNPSNPTEEKLSLYLKQNYDWVNLWESNYKSVEIEILNLHETGDHIRFERWVKDNTTDGVLFKSQADAFAQVYLKNKKS